MNKLLAAALFGLALLLGGAPVPEARCEGWVCVGPCAGPGTCVGHGCVCVGYTTGAGRCVSQ